MTALLDYFIRLFRLQAAPQDLPAAPVLLWLLAALAILAGTLNGAAFLGDPVAALLLNLLDALLLAILLALALQFKARPARFLQTASAMFGLNTLVSVLNMLLLQLVNLLGEMLLLAMLQLFLLVWLQVVSGHILRHALDIPLASGILLAVVFRMLTFMVLSQFVVLPGG